MRLTTRARQVTFAEIRDDSGEVIGRGQTELSPSDKDNPKIGREIAIGRAFLDLLSKEERKASRNEKAAYTDFYTGPVFSGGRVGEDFEIPGIGTLYPNGSYVPALGSTVSQEDALRWAGLIRKAGERMIFPYGGARFYVLGYDGHVWTWNGLEKLRNPADVEAALRRGSMNRAHLAFPGVDQDEREDAILRPLGLRGDATPPSPTIDRVAGTPGPIATHSFKVGDRVEYSHNPSGASGVVTESKPNSIRVNWLGAGGEDSALIYEGSVLQELTVVGYEGPKSPLFGAVEYTLSPKA